MKRSCIFLPVLTGVLSVLVCGGCTVFKPEMKGLQTASAPVPGSEDEPVRKWRKFWMPRYQAKLQQAKKDGQSIRVVLLGDSITHFWETNGRKAYRELLMPYRPLNLGFSGDCTQHTLWIVSEQEPWFSIRPDVAFILIGTNNFGRKESNPAATAEAVRMCVEKLHQKMPDMAIVVFGLFPREKDPQHPYRAQILEMNQYLAGWIGDGKRIFYVDIYDKFLNPDGTLNMPLMADSVHPGEKGYRIWFEAMKPYLKRFVK